MQDVLGDILQAYDVSQEELVQIEDLLNQQCAPTSADAINVYQHVDDGSAPDTINAINDPPSYLRDLLYGKLAPLLGE